MHYINLSNNHSWEIQRNHLHTCNIIPKQWSRYTSRIKQWPGHKKDKQVETLHPCLSCSELRFNPTLPVRHSKLSSSVSAIVFFAGRERRLVMLRNKLTGLQCPIEFRTSSAGWSAGDIGPRECGREFRFGRGNAIRYLVPSLAFSTNYKIWEIRPVPVSRQAKERKANRKKKRGTSVRAINWLS